MNELLELINLNKNFDGIKALDQFSCLINKNEIIGLIGPNGAGKTTLFNVITNSISSESGSIYFKRKLISKKTTDNIARSGISRTFQNLRLIKQIPTIENILLAFSNQPGEQFTNIFLKSRLCRKIEVKNREEALYLLEFAGLTDIKNESAGNLSYGQQKLLSILCCLASNADLLLLDEPVAGINPQMIEKILSIIVSLPKKGKTVILIEHNMDAIWNICNRVIFMDAGKKVSEGTPENVRNDPKVIESYLD
jgi:ABC-type branched-subunit amino acid transport system ATPase component